ncbi:hypothetical protein ACTJIJ_19745 [Niabella sp. 22666]|uniref:hypothetical protein n=1 Tax=Niabella sp. 22666 TaxID=3453954 RepID=UPI003F866FB7
MEISDKSKSAFEAAAVKLGRSTQLPDFSMLPADVALYMAAILMLTTIIEADKDGKVYDITNHDNWKYSPYFYAEEGYVPGSSGGGFSFDGCVHGRVYSFLGARLTFNSRSEGRGNISNYPDLWEIVTLIVK